MEKTNQIIEDFILDKFGCKEKYNHFPIGK